MILRNNICYIWSEWYKSLLNFAIRKLVYNHSFKMYKREEAQKKSVVYQIGKDSELLINGSSELIDMKVETEGQIERREEVWLEWVEMLIILWLLKEIFRKVELYDLLNVKW